ncbi:MAG: hypothetical protein HZC41_15680 [Chloroflexi bacterium]|nr:hypothetical protein [Chloroflexota bacterium]
MKSDRVRLALALIVPALPLLITLVLLRFVLRGDLNQYVPSYHTTYNDAIYYWRQAFTFSQVGFNGGYYTIYELPALATFSHYYVHGLAYPALYGSIGRVFGWYPQSAVVINLALVTFTLYFWVYWLKPNRDQLIILGAAIATFWPLHHYLVSNMQESLQHAIAILVAYAFYRVLTVEAITPRVKWAFAALLLVASLFRFTWSFLLLPLFLLSHHQTIRSAIRSMLLAGILIVASGVIFFYFSAPYPINFVSQWLQTMRGSLAEGTTLFVQHLSANISDIVAGSWLEIGQRLQIIVLIGLSVWGLVLRRRFSGWTRNEARFHLLNLGLLLLIQLAFYDMQYWRDFRVLAAHLLVSVLLLVAFKRYWLVGLFVASNLLLARPFLTAYRTWDSSQFHVLQERIDGFRTATNGLIEYSPGEANSWCNTLLMEVPPFSLEFYPEIMALPPGIGVSFFMSPERQQLPPQSKYLLLSPETGTLWSSRLNIQFLLETQVGKLYLNLDSGCQ